VTSLGDVLELLFARPDPTMSVHAVVHEHRDRGLAERVAEQFVEDHPEMGSFPKIVWLIAVPVVVAGWLSSLIDRIRAPRSVPQPADESELTIWLGPSGRARLERSWQADGTRQRLTSVVALQFHPGGRDFRRWKPDWSVPPGQVARWPNPHATDVERLFGHSLLREVVACLELEPLREDDIAGRPVVVVRATQRPPDGLWSQWLPLGAESYELSFDREFGSLLAFRAFSDGAVFESAVVTEVTFGAAVDERLFDPF
jgi:hypothetical protein